VAGKAKHPPSSHGGETDGATEEDAPSQLHLVTNRASDLLRVLFISVQKAGARSVCYLGPVRRA